MFISFGKILNFLLFSLSNLYKPDVSNNRLKFLLKSKMLQIVQQLILGIISQFLLIYLVYVHPLLQYFRKYANNLQKFRNNVKPILLNPGKMKKIPAHLAISIGHYTEFECFDNNGNTNTSKYLDRLADIAYWASLLNIEYLSFYDPEGIF